MVSLNVLHWGSINTIFMKRTFAVVGTVISIIVIVIVILISLRPCALACDTPPLTSYTAKEAFTFSYPASQLKLTEKAGEVSLIHAIEYPHVDVCDFKGDAPPLTQLTDFNVSIKLESQNFKNVVKKYDQYAASNFFTGTTLQTDPGFIETSVFGTLNGFRITQGVEGCGEDHYYFPVSKNKTLFVKRPWITEFNPISSNQKTFLALPGIITPADADSIFSKILTSLQVTP